MGDVLGLIAELIAKRKPSYIVTANLDFAAQASKDAELQRILVEADLVLCDGMPLLWVSRLTRNPLRERVAGSDLIPKLAERAAIEGWRLFLLGGEESALSSAAANLQKKYPDLIIAGTYSPPFAPIHELNHAEITERIRTAAPDILLVAFGCPKQEKWIYQHYRDLSVPCCIGVGATIDFLAGKVHRAPSWIAGLGLEWVFRLVQEPRRLTGRYLSDIIFLIAQLLRERRGAFASAISSKPASLQHAIKSHDVEYLQWSGPLIAGTVSRFQSPSFTAPFVIDISQITLIDSRGLGYLLQTLRNAWKNGVVGCYASPTNKVLSILEMTRLKSVMPIAPNKELALKLLNREQLGNTPPPVLDLEKRSILLVMPQHVTSETTLECQAELSHEWNLHPSLLTLQLDFGGTLLMDNTGLGFVIHCRQLVSEREAGQLKLLRLTPNVLNAIRTARMESLLGIPLKGDAK